MYHCDWLHLTIAINCQKIVCQFNNSLPSADTIFTVSNPECYAYPVYLSYKYTLTILGSFTFKIRKGWCLLHAITFSLFTSRITQCFYFGVLAMLITFSLQFKANITEKGELNTSFNEGEEICFLLRGSYMDSILRKMCVALISSSDKHLRFLNSKIIERTRPKISHF